MFENFNNSDFNNKILLLNKCEEYSYSDIKQLVQKKYETLPKKKQVLISGDDNFDFIITFFAAVFSKKEIYLVDKNVEAEIEFTDDDSALSFDNVDYKNTFVNFFTSGSCGTFKIVKKSLYNLIKEAQDVGKTFFSKEKTLRVCSTTTLNHLFGCTFHFMTPFVNGFVIDTDSVQYPENVKYSECLLVSSPSFLAKLAKYKLKFKKVPKYIVAAGAKLDDDVFKYFEKKSNVIEIYGSTEAGIIAHRESSMRKFLTLFDSVKVENYKDKLLTIKSDYFFEDSLTLSDYLKFRAPNNISIIARADRVLKISEKRISAEKIEKHIEEFPYIDSAYCLKINEKLAAAVVLNDNGIEYYLQNGQPELIKNLKKHCAEKFEILPQKWRFLPEIYRTYKGKVARAKIEKIFLTNISFPLVLSQKLSENVAEIELIFPEHSNFFQGHFTDFPVVPGVVSLYFVTFFANSFFDSSLSPQIFRKIKFSKLIFPKKPVILKLTNNNKDIDFEIYNGKKVYVSGVLSKHNVFNNEVLWQFTHQKQN